jgi:hypothetical protein
MDICVKGDNDDMSRGKLLAKEKENLAKEVRKFLLEEDLWVDA